MDEETRIKSYKDLLVWQNGIQLVKEVYLLTQQFPREEKFGLVSQMRRACVSVLRTLQKAKPEDSLLNSRNFCRSRKAHWLNWKPS